MGPPVTWGINALSGPFVRRIALPEWTSEQDIHHLTAHCPNLDAVDFTAMYQSVPDRRVRQADDDTNENDSGDADDEEEEFFDYWPPWLDRCPALFQNLGSVRIPYGCWKGSSRHPLRRYQFNRMARFPKNLSLAEHLHSLTISCLPMLTRGTSPYTRRKASANLLAGILSIRSQELTTLALYDSVSNIDNLGRFMQSLTVFPKLRTIKLSLHRDLFLYQTELHYLHNISSIIYPILSYPTKYKDDTASVLQYLSIIKKIKEGGRFSVVPIDKDCGWPYNPREFYGLCYDEVLYGLGNNLWAPVWLWNDRLHWVIDPKYPREVEVVDIGKCRALFKELNRARIGVSLELGPHPFLGRGGSFATDWVDEIKYRHYTPDGNAHDENIACPPRHSRVSPAGFDAGQHFLQRDLPRITSKISAPSSYEDAIQRLSDDPEPLRNLSLHPPTTATTTQSANRTAQPQADSEAPPATNPNTNIPNPIWRLNQIGDLVNDLRLILTQTFAYVYVGEFAQTRGRPSAHSEDWRSVVHKCSYHIRDRLWRESEYTALFFHRVALDFPRLTRFALYIPAALYPDHDQTFIDRVLPGTGWTVRHHARRDECVGDGFEAVGKYLDPVCVALTEELCPFIRRIFTRPTVTQDPASVIVHDHARYVTPRPPVDLDGEYTSMERLLTEPLRAHYEIF